MLEARFTHIDLIYPFAWQLLVNIELGDVLDHGQRLWERVQVLEAMLVRLINLERWPFHLQVEVNEAC